MNSERTTAHHFAPYLLTAVAIASVTACATATNGSSSSPQASARLNQYGYPEKHAPRPTTAAITEQDLMTRLYQFADDSMMGRQIGREGNMKGTAYIASELKRLGIQPGGDNGTYFQMLPNYTLNRVSKANLTIDGKPVAFGTNWVVSPIAFPLAAGQKTGSTTLTFGPMQVIYGGVSGDTVDAITPEQAKGKLVVLTTPARQAAPAPRGRGGFPANRYADAAAVATVNLDNMTPAQIAAIAAPAQATGPRGGRGGAPSTQLSLRLTSEAAAALFGGRSIASLKPGATGGTVNASITTSEEAKSEYARNVIGIIPGSDPVLKNEYVAIGAHNDHIGYGPKVDHDSAFAVRHIAMEMSIVGKDTIRPLTAAERAAIHVNVDSLHRIRPARMDSIANGADDDGSGSMAVLEIAEAISKMPVKPKRSTIFVWHTGEEAGLLGSAYFTEHPTVPITSIVSQVNIDMIGRGRAEDLPGGGPDYLGVVGRNMLSTDLGNMVDSVNANQPRPLHLDDRYDQDVSKTFGSSYNNIYQRSDHYNYAKKGIPIVFFFTGLHGDYHQTTDEPQYIDYPHYARITNYIRDLVVDIGNNPKRPVVNKPIQ